MVFEFVVRRLKPISQERHPGAARRVQECIFGLSNAVAAFTLQDLCWPPDRSSVWIYQGLRLPLASVVAYLSEREELMPIRQKAQEAGVFDSSEVALLGRVFDRLKLDARSAQQREAISSRIIANYMAGIRDEDELVSASRQPLGR
ncbi:hypothetical protein [Mesorhizobium sp. B1-1-2]|uniref:hypothetical protein n=2 Tax=unclassified Mesorhizobium TaxID=325217 RepID=UPI0032B1B316